MQLPFLCIIICEFAHIRERFSGLRKDIDLAQREIATSIVWHPFSICSDYFRELRKDSVLAQPIVGSSLHGILRMIVQLGRY